MIMLLIRFIVLTLLCTALLTPLAMELLELIGNPFEWPFSRVFDRVAMLVIVVLLWFERRSFDLSAIKSAFRVTPAIGRYRQVAIGVVLSTLVSAVTVLYLVYQGMLTWAQASTLFLAWKILKNLVAGIVISLIEESFFRVLLLQSLKRYMSRFLAIIGASVVYAIAHFITPVKTWVYGDYSVFAGFTYLGEVIGRVFAPGLLPALTGLFLVGVCLCLIMERWRSIYLCIGLHAGWVLSIKMTRIVTDYRAGLVVSPGAGDRYFLVAQPETWVGVVLIALLFMCWPRSGFKTSSEASEKPVVTASAQSIEP